MKKLLLFIFIVFLSVDCLASSLIVSNCKSFPTKMIITVPFTDLRKKPEKAIPNLTYPIFFKDNPLQDSQLLMGEYVYAFSKKYINGEKWLQVYALEQSQYDENKWTYKRGWIEKKHAVEVEEYPSYNLVIKSQLANIFTEENNESKTLTTLSIGTKLIGKQIDNNWFKVFLPDGKSGYIEKANIYYIKATIEESEKELRDNICKIALTFSNAPYSWGGRCAYNKYLNYQQTSVDCSGFTNLVYRALGLEIPRDAHDQFLKCNKLKSGKELKNGDLIFFAQPNNPNKIIHVGIFEIDEFFGTTIIESVGEWPFKNTLWPETIRFGKKVELIKNGETCGNHIIYFGSFLNDFDLIKELRATALKNYFSEFKKIEISTIDTLDSQVTLTQNKISGGDK